MNKLLKHKKAQQIFVSLMISVMVLILLVMFSTPLNQEISKSINGTYSGNLSINNPNLSIVYQATTTILDMMLFYFIGTLVAASIAFITGRRTFTGVITAIMIFIVVSVLITPLKSLIILARDSSHLDCGNLAITVGGRLSCIIVDLWLFYFVVTVIAVAAAFIFIKTIPKKT